MQRGKALANFIYLSLDMVDPAREIDLVKPAISVRRGGWRADGFPRIIYSVFESCMTASSPRIFSIWTSRAKKHGSG